MHNSDEIIILIKKKIHYNRNDSLLNHLKTYFQFDPLNFSGTCQDNKFSIWRYSGWSGMFYLVVDGEIITEQDKTIVVVSARINRAGLLLTAVIFSGFLISLFFQFGNSNFTISGFLFRLLFATIFATIPMIAIGLSYLHDRKKAIQEIREIIEVK